MNFCFVRFEREGIARKSLATILAVWVGGVMIPARASTGSSTSGVEFDNEFLLSPSGRSIDVSRFERGNPIAPGSYTVDLVVNENWAGRDSVRFLARERQQDAVLCFDRRLAERIGLNFEALSPGIRTRLAQPGECIDFEEISSDARASFDQSELRLNLSVPQIALKRNPQGYVSPEFWEAGIPSGTFAYNFLGSRSTGRGTANSQAYLGSTAGVNIGSWHFRHNGSLSWWTGRGRSYQSIATYLQHDIPSLQSQMKLGDTFTDGQLFDSFGVRGVQLASDDQMLPESQRGYAPIIRGVANSNARVTVRQHGVTIYETMVAPGAFEIKDLYPTGYGGDLQVIVTEADGTERRFAVPYASVVQLLRPGISRFRLSAGQLRDRQIASKVNVVHGTIQHGFNNLLTGYAGVILAQHYSAGLTGLAVNTAIGAVAFDITHARADFAQSGSSSGQSMRLSYSKNVPATQTVLTASAYRYSASGFWRFRDAMLAREAIGRNFAAGWNTRPRTQLQVSLSQSLGSRWGAVYLTGTSMDYWGRSGSDTFFQAGYNNSFRNIGYTISISRQRTGMESKINNQIYASISIPLGIGGHPSTLTTDVTRDDAAGSTVQAMYSGSAGKYNEFNYGLNAARNRSGSSTGANLQYASPYATVGSSISRGNGYNQVSVTALGAVVAHPGGVTLTPNLGDTVGVVEAPDAAGARIENATGVEIDGRGYAVVPFLTPYSLNTVSLDPRGLPLDVQLETTSQQIAPRANSVVMLRFKTVAGRTALMTVNLPNGAPPFGAVVRDENGNDLGVIGQGGKFFLQGGADSGTLDVRWGALPGDGCRLSYRLPPRDRKQLTYTTIDVSCVPETLHSNDSSDAGGVGR
ncbi:fimbrial biogenesis outer membrane usher protein [Burkholderia metallica]|uniref:fimbria/pilus outer membrane usher protein n=1 Tax=Burkholderia metallica TaxID=488729 RepID=UPI00157AA11C|nr:fimbria/pilus outer membrane usher protein [Burkholderia metallica]NTZ88385.1 fimbrial biogenesis outer membrane usher protein [Burkholderia metallica]